MVIVLDTAHSQPAEQLGIEIRYLFQHSHNDEYLKSNKKCPDLSDTCPEALYQRSHQSVRDHSTTTNLSLIFKDFLATSNRSCRASVKNSYKDIVESFLTAFDIASNYSFLLIIN